MIAEVQHLEMVWLDQLLLSLIHTHVKNTEIGRNSGAK